MAKDPKEQLYEAIDRDVRATLRRVDPDTTFDGLVAGRIADEIERTIRADLQPYLDNAVTQLAVSYLEAQNRED